MHVVPPLGGAAAVADGFGDSSIDVDDGVSEKYRAMVRHGDLAQPSIPACRLSLVSDCVV